MLYTLRFFSSKCSLFHNANLFGSCIIHILYTGCAKIKKNNSGAKGLKKWIPRKCLCFNTHTHAVYTVIVVCPMLCTWPVCGSHKVNKVHTACRIAVTLFFLHYFSAHEAENCAVVDYCYNTASSCFLLTFRDNLSFLPLCSGGGLLCLTVTPVRFILSWSVSL